MHNNHRLYNYCITERTLMKNMIGKSKAVNLTFLYTNAEMNTVSKITRMSVYIVTSYILKVDNFLLRTAISIPLTSLQSTQRFMRALTPLPSLQSPHK